MISILPSIVALLYFTVAVCYLIKKDYAWAVVWAGYAASNVGLILIGMRN